MVEKYQEGKNCVLIVDERATLLSKTPKNAVREALDGLLASLPYAEERWGAVLEATSNLDDLLFSGQAPSLARAVLSPPSWMMSIPWTLLKSVPSSVVVAPRLSAFLEPWNKHLA